MAAPVWLSPAGNIGTVEEQVTTSTRVIADNGDSGTTLAIINGSLPVGLNFYPDGTISGTPHSVGTLIRKQFVVRATNADGITDRSFSIDVTGPTDPIWVTPSGFIKIGSSGQYYSINGEIVDYQFSATYDALPPGQKLRYYIADLDGTLPPGLVLDESGRITGQVKDNLTLDYKAKTAGGYDADSYDRYPFDHVFSIQPNVPRIRKYLSKTYSFFVTVTDGVASSKQLFKITVENPQSLRVDDALIYSDTAQYSADASYLLSPQWLTPANLGYIRANNTVIIELKVYDFELGVGPVTYTSTTTDAWTAFTDYTKGTPVLYNGNTYICLSNHNSETRFTSEYWEVNQLPPYFKLDSKAGTLYANIPYQPAFSINYSFTIFVTKTERATGEMTSTARKFFLTVKGDAESSIQFITDTDLGILYPGRQSELSIAAKHLGVEYSIEYKLIAGRLPTGITLGKDGTLAGSVEYNSQTYIRELSGDGTTLSLDSGTTTFDQTYNFTVSASDVYGQVFIEKDFKILVQESDRRSYTSIYVEPFMKKEQRNKLAEFINDTYVFNKSLLYREQDPAFGLQHTLRVVLEHGIQQTYLAAIANEMRQYFYNKKLYFGTVEWTKATDSAGNYVYDVVYVNIIDPLEYDTITGLTGSKSVGNQTAYPNSIINMRNSLASATVNGVTVNIDEYLLPRFMRTIQPATGNPLGYALVAPLCYALPGKGDTIVKRIAAIGFDFKQLDFEIDRLIVRDNLARTGAKYLLFPRKDANGVNLGEDLAYIYGPEPIEIDTEDGVPIEVET
jgi:hypothetical protein